jgi:hypothetical protein
VYHNGTVVDGKYVKGNFNGKKPIIYIMQVIEYQHRGLPHAHIVYRIGTAPEPSRHQESSAERDYRQKVTIQYIDGYDEINVEGQCIKHLPHVSASRPGKVDKPAELRNGNEEAQCIYNEVLGENNLHKCAIAENACKSSEECRCSRGFEDFIVCQETSFNVKGLPVYKRPTQNDILVVGHNMQMLIDWRAHLNVESAQNAKSVLYIYDYLFKGLRKILAQARKEAMERGESGMNVDEAAVFLRGRILCSMDCIWRALGYSNYPPQQPSTKLIVVMLKSQTDFYLERGKATDMLIFMNRPEELFNLKYEEFYQAWHYVYIKPKSLSSEYFEIQFSKIRKSIFIVKWIQSDLHLVRINMIYPNAGEAWYLRLIHRSRAVTDWEDSYSFNGIIYPSYQEAARHSGFLDNETEATLCFSEAILDANKTPSALRGLFIMLTVDGSPTLGLLLEETYVEAMTADYLFRNPELRNEGIYRIDSNFNLIENFVYEVTN